MWAQVQFFLKLFIRLYISGTFLTPAKDLDLFGHFYYYDLAKAWALLLQAFFAVDEIDSDFYPPDFVYSFDDFYFFIEVNGLASNAFAFFPEIISGEPVVFYFLILIGF